jgi:NADH:ubiquinone oxidoreductase subunit 2 (subunit N)
VPRPAGEPLTKSRRLLVLNSILSEAAAVRIAILLISLAGCAGLSWSAGTLDALVFLSGISLAAAGLLVCECADGESSRAADVRVAAVCFAVLLCGAVFLLALTGTPSLAEISETLGANYQPERSDLLVGRASMLGVVASILVLAGAALPIGLFPFQFSQSEFLDKANGWLALATLSLLRVQGLGLLVRMLDAASIGCENSVQVVTGISGAATCLAGATLLCRVESLRMIAAHLWLIFGGLAVVAYSVGMPQPNVSPAQSIAGLPAATTLALMVTAIGLVVCASLLALEARLTREGRRPTHFEELIGLGRQAPGTAFLLTATLMAALPVPPLPLFPTLLAIAGSAFVPGASPDGRQQELPGAMPLLVLATTGLAWLLIGARLIQPVSQMFHHEPLGRFQPASGQWPLIVSGVCILALVVAGLQPDLLTASMDFLAATAGR